MIIEQLKKRKEMLRYLSSPSSSEVHTPVSLVEEMCNKVSPDFWKSLTNTVLDPTCKSGVFLLEAMIRFMENVPIADEQERYENIVNRLYGYVVNSNQVWLIRKAVYGDMYTEKHIYTKDFFKDSIDMKFDLIVGNPPYNKGLLVKENTPICNTKDEEVNKAASTRIDAAFVVHSYEKLLADNGHLIFVWPYSWTQGPSWSNFRNWIKKSGLVEISAVSNHFDVAVNTAVTLQKKGYTGESYFKNDYRESNSKINFDYEIIPNTYGKFGQSIFEKEQKYKIKTNMIMFKDFNPAIHIHNIMLATGYGLGDVMTQISLNIKDLTPATKHIGGPIKDSSFHTTNTCDVIPVIVFDSKEHREKYINYYNSNVFNFILHQRKADFHNTINNVGSMPDVCKNMVGEYTDQKACDELGITEEEHKLIRETVGLQEIA